MYLALHRYNIQQLTLTTFPLTENSTVGLSLAIICSPEKFVTVAVILSPFFQTNSPPGGEMLEPPEPLYTLESGGDKKNQSTKILIFLKLFVIVVFVVELQFY